MTSTDSPHPPRLAAWLLERFSHILNNPPLAGDLSEAFQQGRSSAWYWRQVLWAVLLAAPRSLRHQWGRVGYAVACSALIQLAWFFIFPVTGHSARVVAVFSDGHIWFSPSQPTGLNPGLSPVFALFARSYAMPWPWSLVYQIAFLTAFQIVLVAAALAAYIGFARILKTQNVLRLLIPASLALAGSSVLASFLGVSDIPLNAHLPQLLGCLLVATTTIIVLLFAMATAHQQQRLVG